MGAPERPKGHVSRGVDARTEPRVLVESPPISVHAVLAGTPDAIQHDDGQKLTTVRVECVWTNALRHAIAAATSKIKTNKAQDLCSHCTLTVSRSDSMARTELWKVFSFWSGDLRMRVGRA